MAIKSTYFNRQKSSWTLTRSQGILSGNKWQCYLIVSRENEKKKKHQPKEKGIMKLNFQTHEIRRRGNDTKEI